MNDIVGNATTSAEPDTRDLIDFFITMGDNLYPKVDTDPTPEEFT